MKKDMQHYMPMPPGIVPPGMTPAPGAPAHENEPDAKRQKTEEANLIPEDQFLLQNSVSASVFLLMYSF
jgi:hypothetical protein